MNHTGSELGRALRRVVCGPRATGFYFAPRINLGSTPLAAALLNAFGCRSGSPMWDAHRQALPLAAAPHCAGDGLS
jgi:hypothetical protein